MTPKRRRNLIDAVLTGSKSSVCIIDADRRVRFFGPGLERRTGWTTADVEGMRCAPASASAAGPIELLLTTLCPPPVAQMGQLFTLTTLLPHRDGTSHESQITFLPITGEDDQVARYIVFLHDEAPQRTQQPLWQKLHAEITALRVEFRRRFADGSLIGRCPEIQRALKQAELLKGHTTGYCISGASGTGRRHIARLIHAGGNLADHSFVALDCRLLLAEQVLESLRRIHHLNRESSAPHLQTGTLVLVDADRCPQEVQTWILDNLQLEIRDVRLVAVAPGPVDESIESEWLLPEFCRLFSAMHIHLPPLHERGDDVALLAQHFVEECSHLLDTSAETLAKETLEELNFYRWPGNVRELQNIISEACQNSFDTELKPADLPFAFRAGLDAQQLPVQVQQVPGSLDDMLAQFETDVFRKTLKACRGNKAEAARRLGMTRPKLYRRMRTLGFTEEELDGSESE